MLLNKLLITSFYTLLFCMTNLVCEKHVLVHINKLVHGFNGHEFSGKQGFNGKKCYNGPSYLVDKPEKVH